MSEWTADMASIAEVYANDWRQRPVMQRRDGSGYYLIAALAEIERLAADNAALRADLEQAEGAFRGAEAEITALRERLARAEAVVQLGRKAPVELGIVAEHHGAFTPNWGEINTWAWELAEAVELFDFPKGDTQP